MKVTTRITVLIMFLCSAWAAASPVQAAEAVDLFKPVVSQSVKNDTSPALKSITPVLPGAPEAVREIPLFRLSKGSQVRQPAAIQGNDPVVQIENGITAMPAPLKNFEGVGNVNSVLPPDTQGDIGYDPATGKKYYVQWVNISFAVWDVTDAPALIYGPVAGKTLWTGFGGPCETENDGDPITLFDPLAKRWLMSQFALPNFPLGPYYQCIAVSQTGDPTGAWHRYAFQVHQTKMNDYPKFGVWPDGYYLSVNQFTNGSSWGGAGVYAFQRDNMLTGSPATAVYFDLYGVNANFGGMLPSDLDGSTPPPLGSPNYFVEVDDSSWIGPADAMRIWKFHMDWVTPANSTFGLSGSPNFTLAVDNFVVLCPGTGPCIPQPGTSQKLDALADRLMHRLAYRNFGTHESLVVNHTVDAGSGRAGIRWYEVRDPNGSPAIHQQGTHAPQDTENRWMGSIAMDKFGNMALGYSVSSALVYPSIRYAGRLNSDTLGILPQGETTLIAGGGSQTHSTGRWGDYSMMSVDPVDDCTFWYTQEYMETTSSAGW